MTFALIVISIFVILYIVSFKLPALKRKPFKYIMLSSNKEFELKRLRKAISKHTGISCDLIYSNEQITQLTNAHVQTIKDLIRMNIHHSITDQYGSYIIKILS